MDAGQALVIGPRKAWRTAARLVGPGTMQKSDFPASKAGMVRVRAWVATSWMLAKQPSFTCC